MDLSVIIVTWNLKDHLRNCLESIKQHTSDLDYEVIVVDNGSHDGTVEMVHTEFPWVTLIANNQNIGFGRANNAGAEHATGEVLFILNDDTILQENSLKKIYDKLQSSPDIGVLGFHLTNPDGSHQDSVRRYPRFVDQFLILSKLHVFFKNAKPLNRYLAADMDYSKEQDVDQVMGACMVMPKEVFDTMGGFDPRFFVWFEEVDLQKRIKEEMHLRIVYSPLTEMVHVKGATFGRILSLTNQKRFNKSMRQYFWKHYGIFPTLFLVAIQPWSLLVSAGVQFLQKRRIHIKKKIHGKA